MERSPKTRPKHPADRETGSRRRVPAGSADRSRARTAQAPTRAEDVSSFPPARKDTFRKSSGQGRPVRALSIALSAASPKQGWSLTGEKREVWKDL